MPTIPFFCRAPRRRLTTVLMALSLLAGLIAIPSGALAVDKAPQAAEPVKFEPGKINRTPVGGPIPQSAATQEAKFGVGGVKVGEEIPERRTEQSKTVVGNNGMLETKFFSVPINFNDERAFGRKSTTTWWNPPSRASRCATRPAPSKLPFPPP